MGGRWSPERKLQDVVGIVFLSKKPRRVKPVEPGEKVEV